MLIWQAVALLNTASGISGCHGYEGVRATLGPQLIAEIGDVTNFTHRESPTAFNIAFKLLSDQRISVV